MTRLVAPRRLTCALLLLAVATLGCAERSKAARSNASSAAPAAAVAPAADAPQPPSEPTAAPTSPWPGITLNTAEGYVDLEAAVATREGEWMELLACTPGTLEYESLLTITARPSHVHLALLALGLEAGKPISHRDRGDRYEMIPARGPEVAISIVLSRAGGAESREFPATDWLRDQATGQPMQGSTWLFTGSAFVDYEGKEVYMADLNGTAITLVNFGEDLLARATDLTNQTDNKAYNVNTPAVPAVGTPVTLRLRPVGRVNPATSLPSGGAGGK